jgi:hypothetical protein
MSAFRVLLGENDAMAHLVNMPPRVLELHRLPKRDGSLYISTAIPGLVIRLEPVGFVLLLKFQEDRIR